MIEGNELTYNLRVTNSWQCMRLLTGVIQLLSNLSFISSGGRKPPREKEATLCSPHKK